MNRRNRKLVESTVALLRDGGVDLLPGHRRVTPEMAVEILERGLDAYRARINRATRSRVRQEA